MTENEYDEMLKENALKIKEPCDDAISRQETIERIKEKAKHIKNEDTLNGLCGAVSILWDMPSVHPTVDFTEETRLEKAHKIACRNYLRGKREALEESRPKGHWITKVKSDLRGDMWPTNPKCSECDGEPYYSNTIYNYKFCPYCGAEME